MHADRRGDIRSARVGRDLPLPADGAGDRSEDRLRAGPRHRHRRVRQPRQARLLLRADAPQQAVGNLRIVGHGVPPGEQEAEEPARILVQLPGRERQPVRRLLPEVPGPGMPHGKALKAVARKRMKVIYAIMRDRVPYAA